MEKKTPRLILSESDQNLRFHRVSPPYVYNYYNSNPPRYHRKKKTDSWVKWTKTTDSPPSFLDPLNS